MNFQFKEKINKTRMVLTLRIYIFFYLARHRKHHKIVYKFLVLLPARPCVILSSAYLNYLIFHHQVGSSSLLLRDYKRQYRLPSLIRHYGLRAQGVGHVHGHSHSS